MKPFIKITILFVFIFSFFKGYTQLITINNIITTDVVVCHGDASGTITIDATGTYPPLTYSIHNGDAGTFQSSNVFNGLIAGTYVIVVKDTYGNVLNDHANIYEPPLLHISDESVTNVTGCYGNTNGSLTISAYGGVGTILYSIDNGITYQASNVFNSLPANTYSVKVKDDKGCVISGSEVEVSQPTEIQVSAGVNNILGCHGDHNGSIEISASGGTSPLKYSIDNGTTWQTSDYFSSLGSGNYQAVVKDAEDCQTAAIDLTVTEPDAVTITSENAVDVTTCHGENTGSITISAIGGTGHLFYAIEGIFQEDNGVFSNLFAGTYNVQVKDENQCLIAGSTLTINQPSEVVIDSTRSTDITTCYGDATGNITIYAHGGIPPLQYSVDNGATWQIANSFSVPAGTYQVLVKDSNTSDCIKTGPSVDILQPIELKISSVDITDVTTCYGGNDGTIHIRTNGGGTPDYEFSIDDGATYFTEYDVDTLSARTFDIIINDAHNCKDTFKNVTINQPSQVIIDDASTILTDPKCFGGTDGSIQVFASGGTGQLVYSSDGGTQYTVGNILAGLSAGINYDIAVKDTHGCEAFGNTYSLNEPDELVIDSIVKQNVEDCNGGSNGSIKIYAKGGTPDIEYSINAGQNYFLTNTFTNLSASSNYIIIKDGHDCQISGGAITITQPEPIIVSYQDYVDVHGCKSEHIGEIHFDASGGTSPYRYSIDGINYLSNDGDFLSLPAGFYQISVKDVNDCLATGNDIRIEEPDTLIVSVVNHSDIDCYGNINGSISLEATGGEFRYYYSIDGGTTYQTSPFFSELAAGSYPVYVKDSYDCIRSGETQDIIQPSDLLIDSVKYKNIEACYGDNDGEIRIYASGGTPGYTTGYLYSIDLGSYWNDNGGVFTNLEPGNYYVKIKDANYCEKTYLKANLDLDTITLTQPSLLHADSINETHIKCYGDDNGIINAYASGGTGAIKYSIDNGATYPNINDDGTFNLLEAGTYVVRMKDEHDCESGPYPVAIYEPDSLFISSVSYQDEQCLGNEDGTITIYAVGGTRPYFFSVDGINFQKARQIQNLAAGTYTPMLKDTNNCSVVLDSSITIISPVNPSLFTTDVTEGCSPLAVQFSRLNDGVTYLWEFGDGQTSSQNEPSHIFNNDSENSIVYNITAYSLSPSSCKDTSEITITVHPQPHLDFSVNPINSYYPDVVKTIINNSPSGYINYNWDFGDGESSTVENPGSHTFPTCGDYEIRAYAENVFHCSDTLVKNAKILAHSPTAQFSVDTTEHCVPYSFSFENQSFYDETFEWVLDDGTIITDNDFSHFYDEDGIYNIQLNVYGFCNTKDSLIKTIKVHESPIVDFEVLPDTVMLPGQPIHCFNKSSEDSEIYFWEFGDGQTSNLENPEHQYTAEGSYLIKLKVISENKCVDSLSRTSEVIVLPAGEVNLPTAFTPNGDGKNDMFMPISKSVKTFKMDIFNRWGELVFHTEDINNGWTGVYNGKISMQDVYVWKAEGTYLNGEPFDIGGSITLLK